MEAKNRSSEPIGSSRITQTHWQAFTRLTIWHDNECHKAVFEEVKCTFRSRLAAWLGGAISSKRCLRNVGKSGCRLV